MKNIKQLEIWMDHSNAYLMELKNEIIVTNRIVSELSNHETEFNSYKGEKLIHKKEQQLQLSYYKKIGDIINRVSGCSTFRANRCQK
jgi:hypothetical protein